MIEIGVITILFVCLLILRMFVVSVYGLVGNPETTKLTQTQKNSINVFWTIVSTITGILLIQSIYFEVFK